MRHRNLRARAGFTLIELLVVVVIIGILASVALPSFQDAQDRARNASMQSNMKAVELAMESYAGDNNGLYPHDSAGDPMAFNGTGAKGFLANNYLPGNKLPRSPWCSQPQTALIPHNGSTPANEVGTPIAPPGTPLGLAGSVGDPPTVIQHYGAIAYATWSTSASSGPQQMEYACHGIGKNRKQAVLALTIARKGN